VKTSRIRDSSVKITAGYGLDGRGSIPCRGKVLLLSNASRQAVWPTQPPMRWVLEARSPGIKRHGREADNSPPSSARGQE
jgi:hypothetical protein